MLGGGCIVCVCFRGTPCGLLGDSLVFVWLAGWLLAGSWLTGWLAGSKEWLWQPRPELVCNIFGGGERLVWPLHAVHDGRPGVSGCACVRVCACFYLYLKSRQCMCRQWDISVSLSFPFFMPYLLRPPSLPSLPLSLTISLICDA